jgi:diadenosine tetraphosphate (Ap4A) HIT family hydrolase
LPGRCPFCHPPPQRIIVRRGSIQALRDAFPCAPGHTLVTPIGHLRSIFDLDAEALEDLFALVSEMRVRLAQELGVDAFTIGVNDGAAAGQTVPHGHVHIIPRSAGDVDDPRGGVRWVLPEKARYW